MVVYRIFECRSGQLEELAFVKTLTSVEQYLESCNKHNTDSNTFYFYQIIKIEN